MAKLRQYCEVSAANCRKPCFITPFMEAGTLSQPLLPAGQFSRHRPSGRYPAPRDAPGAPPGAAATAAPIHPPTHPPQRGLGLRRAPGSRGWAAQRPGARASAPESSGRLPAAALSSRLRSSPASAHLGAAERCGGGESLEVGRGRGRGGAHAGLASPGRLPHAGRRAGRRVRRVTLGGGSAAPSPPSPPRAQREPPQCACAEARLIMCALVGRRR